MSTVALYEHNQKVYDEIVSVISEGTHGVCYVQGTGTGKSFVMMKLINELFADKKVLVVIPKLVLEINAKGYAEFASISDRTDFLSTANFYSRKQSEEIAGQYDVVFVDEAHHLGSELYGNNLLYMKEMLIRQNKYFIGMTATPLRDSDGVNVTTFFEETVYGMSIFQCIKHKLMPKLEYITCSMDLTPEELRDANVRYHVDIESSSQLLQEIVTSNDKKSWLVYFARIEDMDTAELDIRMLFADYKIIKIDSRDTASINEINSIRPDDKVVVMSVNILLEGLHLPNMEAIMLFRDTTSLTVFQQMIGRIMSIGSQNMPLIVDCSSTAAKLLYRLMNPRKYEGDGLGIPHEQYEFRDIVYTSLKNKKYFDISLLLQELHPVRNRYTIADMQKLAKARGGSCLSEEYISTAAKLEWQCSKGHRWLATPNNILAGKWCPTCGNTKKTLDEIQKYATTRGGKCLSTEYAGIMEPMTWQCENNHTWKAPFAYIQRGIWCPKCAGRLRSIDELHEIAELKGGKCLSDTYKGQTAKYKFQCAKGHTWETTAHSIRIMGSWCPACAGKRITLETLQELAATHGGKCLATEYKNMATKVSWQCENGHVFEAASNNVKKGSWCPICNNIKKRKKKE